MEENLENNKYIDIHYQKSPWPFDLNYVGIKDLNVNAVISLMEGQECKERLVQMSILTDLPGNVRGSHISRSVKAIDSHIYRCKDVWTMLRDIAEYAMRLHEYSTKVLISLRTSTLIGQTLFDLSYVLEKHRGGSERYVLYIETEGITVCPSALAISAQRVGQKMTHTQRANLKAKIISDRPIDLRGIPETVKDVFSGIPRAYLRRDEESKFVEGLFKNPMFTEDVARRALDTMRNHLQSRGIERACISVRVESRESVHNFDIVAAGEVCW